MTALSLRVLACLLAVAAGAPGLAQDRKERLRTLAGDVPPLEFKAGASELGMFSQLANTLFKPKGAGPFPTVVVGHTCGGVGRPHIRERMNELLDAGYAVMAVDSFTSRGISQCRGQTKVRAATSVKDAYQALAHLQAMPEVDKSRVFYVGYSWGAMVAVTLASAVSAEAYDSALRYRATVSNYGGCAIHTGAGKAQLLFPDMDRPLLMLMASEDKEFKDEDCHPLVDEIKSVGKPLTYHIYAGVHHAWDQQDQRGFEVIRTAQGESSVYKYSAEATKDSTARMLAFLNANR